MDNACLQLFSFLSFVSYQLEKVTFGLPLNYSQLEGEQDDNHRIQTSIFSKKKQKKSFECHI